MAAQGYNKGALVLVIAGAYGLRALGLLMMNTARWLRCINGAYGWRLQLLSSAVAGLAIFWGLGGIGVKISPDSRIGLLIGWVLGEVSWMAVRPRR